MAYVYRHIRVDKNEPFYIGVGKDDKGKYKRAFDKNQRNRHWLYITLVTEYLIDIIIDDVSISQSKESESYFIKLYGRRDLGLGPLCNFTDGGDGIRNPSDEFRKGVSMAKKGNKNFLGKKHSEETRNKLSVAKSGKNHPMFGKHHKQETKEKIGLIHKGKIVPKSVGEKISLAKRGKPAPNKGKPMTQEHYVKMMAAQKKKKVLKYELDGTFVCGYESIRAASKETGLPRSTISIACKIHNRISHGFVWTTH